MTQLAGDANSVDRRRLASERPSGAETRERIIRAATAQFKVAGYDGTTVSGIARASGVTTPALYWHFPSKEEIAFACIERNYDNLYTAVRAADNGTGATERLRSVVGTWVKCIIGDVEVTTGLNLQQLVSALSDEHQTLLRARDREFQAVILTILAEGVAEGCFKVQDPIVTAQVIITACEYSFVWLKPGRKRTVDYIANHLGELMVAMASNAEGD